MPSIGMTIPIQIVAQTKPPIVPIPAPQSLYSNEWTSDKQPRQKSVDFISMKDYGAKVGLPDQFQIHPNVWIPLTLKLQTWLADVLGLAWIGTPYSSMSAANKKLFRVEWASIMDGGRCFTNRNGWNNGKCDYIQGLNVGADPMEWEPLLLAGNKLEVIGDPVNLPTYYFGKQESRRHYPVRVVDPAKLPKPEAFLLDKAVCHTPTTIKSDGTHGLFPQFSGRAVYPLWAKGGKAWVWDRLMKV